MKTIAFFRIIYCTNDEIGIRRKKKEESHGKEDYQTKILYDTNEEEIEAFIGLWIFFGLSGFKNMSIKDIFSLKSIGSLGSFNFFLIILFFRSAYNICKRQIRNSESMLAF